jgi:hypothetical protein
MVLAEAALAASPQRHTLDLPGRVVASAALAPRGLALATVDEEGRLALWRLDAARGGAPRLRSAAAELPAELSRVPAEDRAAPGVALAAVEGATAGNAFELLVSRPGGVWRVGPAGVRRLHAEPGFALATAAPEGGVLPAPPLGFPLVLARAGELVLLDGTGAEPRRLPLPLEATPRAWGLDLGSPPVRRLPQPVAGTLAVVGPQRVGERRLRTLLVDAAGNATEAWSLLPAGERLLGGRPIAIDGQLILAVTAAPPGMLAEQRLHLFRLAGDRTRGGNAPLLSTQLQVRHWESPDLVVGDRDGDGRDDLVVVEPRGLGGGQLTLSTYRGLGGGRLAPPSRRRGAAAAPRRRGGGARRTRRRRMECGPRRLGARAAHAHRRRRHRGWWGHDGARRRRAPRAGWGRRSIRSADGRRS